MMDVQLFQAGKRAEIQAVHPVTADPQFPQMGFIDQSAQQRSGHRAFIVQGKNPKAEVGVENALDTVMNAIRSSFPMVAGTVKRGGVERA